MIKRKAAVIILLAVFVISMFLFIRTRWSGVPYTAPQHSHNESKHDKLDPELLVSRKDMLSTLSAAHLPCRYKVAPIYTEYWDTKSGNVMIEPMPARKLVDEAKSIIWHNWTADGKGIIYSTRSDIALYDISSRKTKQIVSLPKINLIFLSPDRQKIAIANNNELMIVDLTGSRKDNHIFSSPVLSAAWSPDSTKIACTTRNKVWLIHPGISTQEIIHHRSMKDMWADPVKWRSVQKIDSVSWSSSGSEFAYCVYTKDDDDYKPYIMVLNLTTGRSRLVGEGFSEEDRYYCWTPVDDWMVLCGNMGEVDASIFVQRAWSDESYQAGFGGASTGYRQLSWQPYSGSFAVNTKFIADDEVLEPLYSLNIFSVLSTQNYYRTTGGIKAINELVRKSTNVSLPGLESGIPDFDWAPDGSWFVYVERLYSAVQWKRRKDESFPGEPFVRTRVQHSDSKQHALFWDGDSPVMTRFSSDGLAITYISDGDVWRRDVQAIKRSKSEARRLLREGRDLYKSGNLVDAVYALRNSVRHSPDEPGVHRTLAQVYWKIARRERNPYRKYNLLRAAEFESRTSDGDNAEFTRFLSEHLHCIQLEADAIR